MSSLLNCQVLRRFKFEVCCLSVFLLLSIELLMRCVLLQRFGFCLTGRLFGMRGVGCVFGCRWSIAFSHCYVLVDNGFSRCVFPMLWSVGCPCTHTNARARNQLFCLATMSFVVLLKHFSQAFWCSLRSDNDALNGCLQFRCLVSCVPRPCVTSSA